MCLRTLGNIVVLVPPLAISADELDMLILMAIKIMGPAKKYVS